MRAGGAMSSVLSQVMGFDTETLTILTCKFTLLSWSSESLHRCLHGTAATNRRQWESAEICGAKYLRITLPT